MTARGHSNWGQMVWPLSLTDQHVTSGNLELDRWVPGSSLGEHSEGSQHQGAEGLTAVRLRRAQAFLPATHLLPRVPEAGSFEGFPAELDNMKPLQKSVIA